jgi:hypothetical protein
MDVVRILGNLKELSYSDFLGMQFLFMLFILDGGKRQRSWLRPESRRIESR